MGKTEAFCTKCGSLINIDDSKEKNKCIFCDTEVATGKALDLKNDAETRVSLQKESEKKAKDEALQRKQNQKQNAGLKTQAAAAPAVSEKQMVVLKPLPMKIKLMIFGSFIGIVLLLAAIFVPTVLSRNQKRTELNSKLTAVMDFKVKSNAFKFNDNRQLSLATDEELTGDDATAAYKSYLAMYKEAYDLSDDKAKKKVAVLVYAKNGLYTCMTLKDEYAISFVTSTPTPTIKPTESIKEP